MLNKNQKRIYLDHSASAPIDNNVLRVMRKYYYGKYGNPSSLHSSGRLAKLEIEKCKQKISEIIGSKPNEIIFTSSGTESDNMAIIGLARANRSYGNHIIISTIEHKAVIESVKVLEKEGFEISYLQVDRNGIVDLKKLDKLIKKQTILISIIYANNEIGTIQPIYEISKLISDYRERNNSIYPYFHTDACQAAGYLDIDIRNLGVDLMTLNGSKIYGPKGVGILFKKDKVSMSPIIVGGEQELRLRAGTESLPNIVGFAEALSIANAKADYESKRLVGIREYFIGRLLKSVPNLIINGHRTSRLPNNIHVSIPNVEGESILLMLDEQGIEVSTGSACSASDLKPSHVLIAIGQTSELAHGSIRFTLGRTSTKKEIDYVVNAFTKIISKLSKISSSTVKNYGK